MPLEYGDQKSPEGTLLVDTLLVARGSASLIGLEHTSTENDVALIEFEGQVVSEGGWVEPGKRKRIVVALTKPLALGMTKQLLEFFVWLVEIADIEASANTRLSTENEQLKLENKKLHAKLQQAQDAIRYK